MMLRTAIKCLLTLALILQGAVGAFASTPHHCDGVVSAGSTQHPVPHQPCCPHQDCVASCDLCGVAFLAPVSPVVAVVVTHEAERDQLRIPARSHTSSPPIRPPIA
jgi:hypothetical protein